MQSIDAHGMDQIPPPAPDESYWAALLNEADRTTGTAAPFEDNSADWPSVDNTYIYQDQPAHGSAHAADDWITAQNIYSEDRAIDLLVVGFNRGGLLVEWNSLRGFVPASQLINAPTLPDNQARRQHLQGYVNQLLTLRIIELEREQNRLILSERAAQARPGARAGVMDTLQPGDTVRGRITNLCDFGAFVDLGGLEGLIHISELSWGRVNHPRDLLKRGDEIRVYVMDIHRDLGRIALSVKRLQADPWASIETRYQLGQMVEGTITNIVDFGAFACVEEGLEGLIHVSELAEGHFLHPRNVVREGDRVLARILNIDGRNRRLGLSLREHDHVDSLLGPADAPKEQSTPPEGQFIR